MKSPAASPWFIYMLRCGDNSLYTGVTTDLKRREREHNSPHSTTRYTRARQPVRLVYAECSKNRSSACSREYHIKKLSRKEKETLIRSAVNILDSQQ